MNMQHERINHLCEQLNLPTIAQCYSNDAQEAADKKKSYSDFLEQMLAAELSSKQARGRSTLTKMAGFPILNAIDLFNSFSRLLEMREPNLPCCLILARLLEMREPNLPCCLILALSCYALLHRGA